MSGDYIRQIPPWVEKRIGDLWSAVRGIAGTQRNRAYMRNAATTNGQGSGGPTIVAALSLTVKAGGIFLWWAAASQPAAAATEVATFTVTSQTGTGAVAFTGNTANGINGQVATAAAGTGIVVSTGGGSEKTLGGPAITVGTAAVGASFALGGIMDNSTGTTETPFTVGNNVFLLLKWTNSATNRVVSSIACGLIELAA